MLPLLNSDIYYPLTTFLNFATTIYVNVIKNKFKSSKISQFPFHIVLCIKIVQLNLKQPKLYFLFHCVCLIIIHKSEDLIIDSLFNSTINKLWNSCSYVSLILKLFSFIVLKISVLPPTSSSASTLMFVSLASVLIIIFLCYPPSLAL